MKSKKLRKVVISNFNNLEKAAKKIAKAWDLKTIPILTINEMIDKIRFETDEKELQEFKNAYNKTLETLKVVLKTKVKEMNTKSVSIEYLSQAIKVIKEGFTKRING